MLDKLGVGTSTLTAIAQTLAGGVLGFVASAVVAALRISTFAFFTYYFSADGPRLRRWTAQPCHSGSRRCRPRVGAGVRRPAATRRPASGSRLSAAA